MKARSMKITAWTAQDVGADVEQCGLKGSPTKVVKIFPPTPRGQREILTGTIEQQMEHVANKLREQSLI
jgi:electron transfer flavoprotein beta subunit